MSDKRTQGKKGSRPLPFYLNLRQTQTTLQKLSTPRQPPPPPLPPHTLPQPPHP
jgi:hypothetical protein